MRILHLTCKASVTRWKYHIWKRGGTTDCVVKAVSSTYILIRPLYPKKTEVLRESCAKKVFGYEKSLYKRVTEGKKGPEEAEKIWFCSSIYFEDQRNCWWPYKKGHRMRERRGIEIPFDFFRLRLRIGDWGIFNA
ncbi:hypothetical protein KQX54_006583 [Cotesia glomerata]|uniref:Uncharacterized protein n=1 Tax=Cotesia glomerata TaxID=32391 RepID=A0AAV7HPS1_COTGL|nr:hypothetical protein KQX54_006583 [Cotesia glomerata]